MYTGCLAVADLQPLSLVRLLNLNVNDNTKNDTPLDPVSLEYHSKTLTLKIYHHTKKMYPETQGTPLYFLNVSLSLVTQKMHTHAWTCVHTGIHKHKHTNLFKTETDVSALNPSMFWLVSLEAASGEPGDWMRPFESWLVRGRSIVKDSWASCFLLSLWGQWAPNMKRLGFYHPLPPSPPRICSSIDCDCLSFCLRPLLDSTD